MTTVYVKPREGGRVRMPDRNYTVMPEAGILIERDMYYERLLITGDIVECEPPKASPAEAVAAVGTRASSSTK